MFLNGLGAADANAEVIDVAAQHAPRSQARRRVPPTPMPEAGPEPSSLGAAWRANGIESMTLVSAQVCLPAPIKILPGVSGPNPRFPRLRSFAPSSSAK